MSISQRDAAAVPVGARVAVGYGGTLPRSGAPRLVDVGTLEQRRRGYVVVRVRLEEKRYQLVDLVQLVELRDA